MHTSGYFAEFNSVSAFLTKLWKLVDDESRNELICWDPSGKSFHVFEQDRFAKEILPLYFKHNNMASFIRQLNMYGFRKVISLEPQNVKTEKDDVAFMHPYFVRGQEAMLENIKRKVSTKMGEESLRKEEELNQVLSDVTVMKGKHNLMESQLQNLKRENERLWRDVSFIRQQQLSQSQVVEKLIHFLVSMMKKSRSPLGAKRRLEPLMIEDAQESETLPPKMSRKNVDADYHVPSTAASAVTRESDERVTIPKIFDVGVTDQSGDSVNDTNIEVQSSSLDAYYGMFASKLEPLALLDDDGDDITSSLELTDLLNTGDEAGNAVNDLLVYGEDPTSQTLPSENVGASSSLPDPFPSTYLDPSIYSTLPEVTTVALSDPLVASEFNKADMIEQLDCLQTNIDNIRDLFARGQYSFDANTLFGLFNGDQSNPSAQNLLYDLGIPDEIPDECDIENLDDIQNKLEAASDVQGNEMIQYVQQEDLSSLFSELGDLENTPGILDEQAPPSMEDNLDYISSPIIPLDYAARWS